MNNVLTQELPGIIFLKHDVKVTINIVITFEKIYSLHTRVILNLLKFGEV